MKARALRLAAMAAVAMALRLGFGLTRQAEPAFPDAEHYQGIARNLLAGRGFIDPLGRRASRAPGYPLFLAGCYAAFGQRPWPALTIQSALGAGACLLLFLLARRLFDQRTGELAGWIAAGYPFLAAYSGLFLSEALFIPLLLLAVLLLETPWRATLEAPSDAAQPGRGGRAWAAAAGAGLSLGLAILVRSSLLFFPLFCLPFWLAAAGRRARALGLWSVLVLVAALVQIPWVLRNYRVFRRFIPTTLQVGESLLEGNGPGADGGPRIDRMARQREPVVDRLPEFERDQLFRRQATRWIRENPAAFALLAVEKLRRFWNVVPNAEGYRTPLVVLVSLLTYVPVMAFALAGMAASAGEWRRRLLLVVPVLYYSALHTVFVGSTRYRTPIMPYLMAFSAWGFWLLSRRAAGSRRKASQPGGEDARQR